MKRILLVVFSLAFVLVGCGNNDDTQAKSDDKTGAIGSELTYQEFSITLDDAYYAKFPHDGIEINFDKYLAADFTIENSSKDPVVAKTLTNFTVIDDNDNMSRVMIDENKKKFNASLMPGEKFEITLVFPVMESEAYTIYYSYGAKQKNENVLSWKVKIGGRKSQTVEETIEHREVEDVVDSFLLADGSNKIEFDANPKSEANHESEKSEVNSDE